MKKMRIVAGEYRSRVIQAVDGQSTRPTTDKIKEAIFSRIGPYFDGGEMLDLFAGSGNMTLEAISRGMDHSLMVDYHGKAISTIQQNIRSLDCKEKCDVWKMDYKSALRKASIEGKKFDLVYLDPPYKKQQIMSILTYLEENDMLCEDGDIVCESLKEDTFEDVVGSLEKVKDVTYGITRITYYKKR
ncbi:16S rRNA (guanine(966)-N(2))-methyltransferase RsmD [Amedibacillus sp. YH-ame6]